MRAAGMPDNAAIELRAAWGQRAAENVGGDGGGCNRFNDLVSEISSKIHR